MKSEWFKRWDDDESVDDYWAATREEGDFVDEKESGNGWWSKFHGSKKKSSYTPVKSTSAYLRSSYSTWHSSVSARSDRDDLLEVLKEVNKTINLTQNSSDGKSESSLVVRYSNGSSNNDLTSNVLYISPDVIRDSSGSVLTKDGDEYYNSLDALNGQAMLCSFMKKSVSHSANVQYVNCDNWAIRNIYMTDLQTTAGNEICSDWPGFRSYIEQQQRIFQISKEEVLQNFNDPNQNIDNFINLICYNRLSKDRIDYASYFEKNIADRLIAADYYLNSTLDEPWHNDGRFDRASDIFSTVQRMLSLDEPPPPPPGGGSEDQDQDPSSEENNSDSGENDQKSEGDQNDQGSGESDSDDENQSDSSGDSDSDSDSDSDNENQSDSSGGGSSKMKIDNIDTDSNSGRDRRFTGDNSYNGQQIENQDEDSAEIDPDEKLKDQVKCENDDLKNIQDKQLDDVRYHKIIPAVNDEERTDYKDFVVKSRRAINAIKDCFQFHNTDVGMYSYGLSAGNIDENSMFKVYMGENDRLYERKDIMTRKKWLVTILIDQSGSMCDPSSKAYSSKQDQANQLAIVFSEALKGLRELDFSIYGFSTRGCFIDTFVYKDKTTDKLEALIHAESHEGTGMGFHIAHVGDKMISQYDDYENKILFVVTDGEPNHTPTPTMNGYEHTRYCCDILRKRGIQVYTIVNANAFGNRIGDLLFGSGQYCVINDVAGTLNLLVSKVRSFLQRKRK